MITQEQADLAFKVQEHIRKPDVPYNQNDYRYCFAGWALRLTGQSVDAQNDYESIPARAAATLGLTDVYLKCDNAVEVDEHNHSAWQMLFRGRNTPEDIDRLIEEIYGEFRKDLTPA